MKAKFNRRCVRLLAGAGLGLIGALLPAVAQAETSDEPFAGEIIVTAQKRSQRLQDVAGSVSAIGSADLKAQGITSISEVANRVSGLEFGYNGGATFVVLRGVGVGVDNAIAEPSVATYVDGVFLPRSTMSTLSPLDLDRIEVVRGPQGTLYGRNATGGAINFISKRPTDHLSGEARLSYGNYDTLETNVTVSGPLAPGIRVRLGGSYGRRGKGYLRNILDDTTVDKNEKYGVRGAVEVDVASNLTATFSLDYQWERFQTAGSSFRPNGPLAVFVSPALATAQVATDPFKIATDFNPWSRRSTMVGRGQLDWQISPNISLRSITGYVNHKFDVNMDGDYTSVNLDRIEGRTAPSESVSQEFDVTGSLPKRGSWLVGANYYHEKSRNSFPLLFPIGAPGLLLPPGSQLVFDVRERTSTLALFGDSTIGLSDRFRLYGGARISFEKKDFIQSQGATIPGLPSSLTLSCENQTSQHIETFFTPRIGAQVDLAKDVSAYAQYSKGSKSGGLNQGECGNYFSPEKLNSYEVGLKTQFLDKRGTLNAAFFYYDYPSYQVLQIVGLSAKVSNASTRIFGAEAQLDFRISNIFSISASGTWLNAKYQDFHNIDTGNPAAGVQDLRGNPLNRSPDFSGTFSAQASIPLAVGPFRSLTIRGDVRASTKVYFLPFPRAEYEQKGYAMVNLDAVLASAENGLTIRGFVHNLGNLAIRNHSFYNPLTDNYVVNYQPPRTYGVEIGYSF